MANINKIKLSGTTYSIQDLNVATVSASTAANTTALGGLKLVSLTQAQYDTLTTKDSSTVYFING